MFRRFAWSCLVASVACVGTIAADDDTNIDPVATKILKASCDFLATAPSVSTEIKLKQTVVDKSRDINFNQSSSVSFATQKPNKIAVRVKNQVMGLILVSDGKILSSAMPQTKRYTQEDAPNDLDLTGTSPMVAAMTQMIFIDAMVRPDGMDKLMEGVNVARVVGEEDLDGVAADRLSMVQDDMTWDIWIQKGDSPVPLKLEIKMNPPKKADAEDEQTMSMTMDLTFANWKIGEELPADTFAFTPEKGWEKKESLFEMPEAEPHGLLGQAAPEFSLPKLKEGEIRLSDLKGKVVVLDFWATWCGPCVQALPVLSKVADQFKDKDVVFLAVNTKEEREDVESFLEDHEISFDVVMDLDGAVSEDYLVQGIPQTVVIDKAGIVQVVHMGFNPAMKKTFPKELDDVLAGKNLAKETLDKAEESQSDAEFEEEMPERRGLSASSIGLLIPLAGGRDVEEKDNVWTFATDAGPGTLTLDEEAGQLSVAISPAVDAIDEPMLRRLLEANADDSLEGRYALREGKLLAVYSRSTTGLLPGHVVEGIKQIRRLADTVGKEFSARKTP